MIPFFLTLKIEVIYVLIMQRIKKNIAKNE